MIRSFYERLIRRRWAFPLMVGLAVTVMMVNEFTYRHSQHAMRGGVELADANVQAQETLQLLVESEVFVRGFIIDGVPARLATFRHSQEQFAAVSERMVAAMAKADPQNEGSVRQVLAMTQRRMAALDRAVRAKEAGDDARAREVLLWQFQTLTPVRPILNAYEELLSRTSGLQDGMRTRLFSALEGARWVVHLLTLLVALGLYGFMRQVQLTDSQRRNEKRLLEQQVAERTGELGEMARHLMTTREDERGRLARELHDELGGLLSAVKLDLARLRRMPGVPEEATLRLKIVESRLNEGIAIKRRVIENLRPSALDHLGLADSLSVLCRETADGLGIPVHEALEPMRLHPEVELAVYRVVQEALTNVQRHARATEVFVELGRSKDKQGDWVTVQVSDNGQGFAPGKAGVGHHGLSGMRLRMEAYGGSLHIDTTPGGGSTVAATLPFQPRDQEDPAAASNPALTSSQ